MFSKALWLKHSKQSRLVLILLYLVHIIIIPFSYYNNVFDLKNALSNHEYPHFGIGEFSMLTFLSPVMMIVLSILLIGIERNTGGIDFQFSLPYTPKQLFLSKWIFGVVHIIIATAGLLILTLVINYSTILSDYIDVSAFIPIFITLILFPIAFFTVSLSIGSISGHYFSQSLFNLFTIFSPVIIYYSIFENYEGIFNKDYYNYFPYQYYFEDWTLPFQATDLSIWKDFTLGSTIHYPTLEWHNILVIIIYTLVFLTIGLFCYSRNANANNGKLFVFKRFGIFVNILFVYFSATLVAMLTSSITNGRNPIIYIIGLLIGTFAGYFFYKRLNKFFD